MKKKFALRVALSAIALAAVQSANMFWLDFRDGAIGPDGMYAAVMLMVYGIAWVVIFDAEREP